MDVAEKYKNIVEEIRFNEPGSYWYMIPVYLGMHEFSAEDLHMSAALASIDRAIKDCHAAHLLSEEFRMSLHLIHEEDTDFEHYYRGAVILFCNGEMMMLPVATVYDNGKIDGEFLCQEDLLEDEMKLEPFENIGTEIKRRFGVTAKEVHYLGRMADETYHAEVSGMEDDDGNRIEDHYDVFLCTSWEGKLIPGQKVQGSLEEYFDSGEYQVKYVPIRINELGRYLNNNETSLMAVLSGNFNNYPIWAKLLYYTGVLRKYDLEWTQGNALNG